MALYNDRWERVAPKILRWTAAFRLNLPGRSQAAAKGVAWNPMSEDYQIAYVDEPAWTVIGKGIRDFNQQQAGADHYQNLCFVLRAHDDDVEVVGGVIGATYWEWFYLDLLWVREDLRGRGYGHRLLTRAEDLARQRGAKNAYLDTFSFQALDFYRRRGYSIFGELEDFPPGHQRYFLRKRL
jgi:GNAT superfamily N-acetyltransferase